VKCGSPRGNLGRPRGGEEGGARDGLDDAWRGGTTQGRRHAELAKLSAAMAMAPLPSKGAIERQSEWEQRWASAGVAWRP